MAEHPSSAVAAGLGRVAREDPDRTALAGAGATLTFAELDREVDAAAERLRRAGLARGAAAIVELDRDPRAIVALLALWRLGAAAVPIDPAAPEPFRQSLRDQAAGLAHHRIVGDGDPGDDRWQILELTPPAVPPLLPVRGDDVAAYAMFTSGTMGRRRLVVVGQRQVDHLQRGLERTVYDGLDPAVTPVAVCGPLSFDTSIKQVIRLGAGHPLVLVPADVRADPARLARHLREHGVAVVDATPRLVSRWQRDGVLHDAGAPLVSHLLVGGEAIHDELWSALAAVPDLVAFDLYGPTECTVDAMVARIEGDHPHLGQPLPGATVELLDGDEAVADWVVGEMVISGAGVAWGYVGPDQGGFEDVPTGRRYRTGDLARRRGDGTVEFVGRADGQAKAAGVRLDLSEVEAALCALSGVREAAAAIDADGNLAAVVVTADGVDRSAASIRADLVEQVPLPFVPASVAVVAELPLTARGKVDRDAVARAGHDPGEPTVDPVERSVAEAMAEVVGGEPLRRDESFFRRGGDSLGVLEVVARLADTTGALVEVGAVIARPTPRAVAELVRSGIAPAGDPAPAVDSGLPSAPGRRSATTSRSLADRIACGALEPLDAVALNAIPDVARRHLGSGEQVRELMEGLPLLAQVRRTELGVLGVVLLPCYASEAGRWASELVGPAMHLAGHLGARAVSLTGELAPATDHGVTVASATGSGPVVTTGQGSTVAAMLATWDAASAARRRPIGHERLATVGFGALTAAFVDAVADGPEVPLVLGPLDDAPELVRDATSVVVTGPGAHQWLEHAGPDVLVVEYGTGLRTTLGATDGPFVANGGALRARRAIDDLTAVDPRLDGVGPELAAEVLEGNETQIAACALAALLVAIGDAPRVRGIARPDLVAAYRSAHRRWGFTPIVEQGAPVLSVVVGA